MRIGSHVYRIPYWMSAQFPGPINYHFAGFITETMSWYFGPGESAMKMPLNAAYCVTRSALQLHETMEAKLINSITTCIVLLEMDCPCAQSEADSCVRERPSGRMPTLVEDTACSHYPDASSM